MRRKRREAAGTYGCVEGDGVLRRRRSRALRLLIALTLAGACGLFGAAGAAAQDSAGDVLLFHGGTSQSSVSAGVAAITALGEANDFGVDATTDAGAFTTANLADYRAVVVLHSSGDVLNAAQRAALQSYIQGGGGFVGIGEAANLQPGDSFFSGLIGARPAAGSSDAVTQQLVEVGDRVHPATRELPLEWGPRSDVWYQWQQNPTGTVHTVARARFGATADDAVRSGTTSRPISWCRDFQGGRSFYTGMGRTAASYGEADFRDHLLGAIQWAAGMVRGGCKATISSNYQSVRLTNGSGALANSGESHGVSIASNGWVFTIGRAACGSDAERGARVGQSSLGRTLDFANPNVGVGCAPIHIFDPAQYNGTVNSGNTRAGTLTVYGDRGNGGETNGKIETGGLGIAVSPDFAQTGHVYIQYFPSFNAQNPIQAGLPDGAARRITKMGKGRISRFTVNLNTKQLNLSSEVKIFEYDSQIYSCCHRGGGMGFDSEGNLYVTTGDSNSSGGGYSGNYQNVRCPTGDPAVATNAHCGSNGISYRDARRTAGSTNDYNGKMLRFNPIEGLADGATTPVGVNSTYTLPDDDSPNGPNLFDGTEGGGGKAKPEIYAMGLRNPSRLTIDPKTDMPYSAWVGPDAGSPSATQGPSTYEVASQIPRAGNWGWPYCMGNKQAYRDRTSAGGDPLRTTNASGYVTGGPAGSGTPGWYDCDNLVNDSTNNTGLTTLPHDTGTGADAGKVSPANIWYSRGNPGGDGCPVFPRENGAGSAPNYGGTNTQLCPYYNGLGGHTVMSGPVYRYDGAAASNARRWPAYWDGRWFVNDFSGGNNKSFGFTFDEATAEAGGQPSYVDKMSSFMSWSGGSYMDSKFGPDGALYVQTYDSYFEHGNNNGLHRITYTGGADTPGPDPQWQAAGNAIAFSIGKSGGVSYEWDFDDGSAPSTERNPTHTYAASGTYDAKLTVTYADGEEASKTVEVIASDDAAAPVTTASLNPAQPGPGGTYEDDVTVTLSATDGTGDATGVELTEHRVNGGTWTESENTEDDEPFVTTLTVDDQGENLVEFRSRDAAGNLEAIKSVEFSIERPATGCNPLSDQFDGGDLDDKWELINPHATSRPSVEGGQLTLPLVQGDLYTTNGSAQALLQQVPAGSWVATAKIAHANINVNGEAAGLGLVNRFSPNHFVKTAIQFKSDTDPNTAGNQPGKWAERVLTANGASVVLPGETVAWPNSGALNLTGQYVWVRFVYDDVAKRVTTWTSTNGTTFVQFGAPVPVDQYLSQPGGLRIGLFGKHDGAGDDEVQVDAFNVVSDTTDPQTPSDDCGGAGRCPQTDEFDGTALGTNWEIRNPNPAGLSVGDGHLTLNSAQGDVSGTAFSAQNILLQDVPEGQWSATAKVDHRAIAVNGQAAGLVIYGRDNPNYFAKTAIQWKNDWQGAPVNGFWAERILTVNGARNAAYGGEFPNSGKLTPAGNYVWLRATYDGTQVATEYSLDGETWAASAPPFPASVLGANGVTKIGLFTKDDGGSSAAVRFDSFVVDAETCGEGGDNVAPTTTHTLDPAQPGASGWYTSPVEVTLNATDNQGGSGVESTEYRFAGDAAWTAYDDPFTVDEDGEHTIEYRSTDEEGNVENTRRVSLKVDATDPTTTAKINGEAPAEAYEEAVEVDLDADDGAGSGIDVTEIRVDGGQWQPYVEEETILGSSQDLQAWEQAGPGGLTWVDQDGGFARTTGGMGMPWYPKEYGDFSLKMQWRDSSTANNGNSGIFARFPHPTQTVARPAGERYPCQVGSATSDPAWVAIFCGHEIQINDHQGDAQKTGSIYNFAPRNATQAKVQPKGTWVDYELRVVGQTYTIVRNGEVIQEWVNAPDQNSSRAGDPPTNARQFARGYIGLQNHNANDVVDFRNVRVLPLDAGAVRGPVTVEGDGEHTVEYRSTDAAGNEEAVKAVTFTIGAADETAPTTESALDGDGPVEVTLSATDPEPGAPQNHDVDAEPATWSPSSVTAKSGDKVTWHFPVTGNTVHDVWLYKPGAPTSNTGTKVTDPVEPEGEPVSFTFDEEGTWTYLCKIHGLRNAAGEFSGMFGTVDVAPGTATGVASTEYRINTDGATGEWIESENDAGDDPFETTFEVADLGDHVVEYRSTDVAGNVESTKSVEFSISAANGAPSVQVSANPIAGLAPLTVQFDSVATDPDGDPLTTTWEFGDGGSATGATPAHTYLQPGTYTARVTATDPTGLSASATVQVTVSAPVGGSGDPPSGGGDKPANRPGVKAPKRAKGKQVRRSGLRVEVTCTVDCRAGATLRLSGKQIGKANVLKVGANGKRTLVIKLDRKGRRKLQAALRKPGVKSKQATVAITITSADGTSTVRRTVKLTG